MFRVGIPRRLSNALVKLEPRHVKSVCPVQVFECPVSDCNLRTPRHIQNVYPAARISNSSVMVVLLYHDKSSVWISWRKFLIPGLSNLLCSSSNGEKEREEKTVSPATWAANYK